MHAADSLLAPLLGLVLSSLATAQVQNLRITEVDPATGQVEVTNTGPAHTTPADHPFCHRFNYMSVIPAGTSFGPGEIKLFNVSSLNPVDSDLWLYISPPFPIGANIVHGLKYGPAANIGRQPLASSAGSWSGSATSTPASSPGRTLAYDGFGFESFDWYVDETPSLGAFDITIPGSVPTKLTSPFGLQDFESAMLGDTVIAISGWPVVNTSGFGMFDVRVVDDVNGVVAPRPGSNSTRWLRIHDQDGGPAQNRFYSTPIQASGVLSYEWRFFVNLLKTPPGGAAVKPRITIQHVDLTFSNAFGIEFSDAGADLVVTGIGGPAASTPLFALNSPTGVGDWVELELAVDFTADTVSAAVNGGVPVSLPIALSLTVDKSLFRICYRGEGNGNVNTMLLDDVSVQVDEPAMAAFRNGGGTNSSCYSSVTQPVSGMTWVVQVDATGHAGAIFTGVQAFNSPSAGVFFKGSEILVNLFGGAKLFSTLRVTGGGVDTFNFPIPPDPAFLGRTAFTQGFVLGGGVELCNALDATVGA